MFTSIAINQVHRRLDGGCTHERTDFFDRALFGSDVESRGLPLTELVFEAVVLLNVGSDTTASSPTSLVCEVTQNPEIQAKLNKELDEALGSNAGPAPFDLVTN